MDIQHTCTRKECYMKDIPIVEGQGASTRISFVDSSAHVCFLCSDPDLDWVLLP